MGFLFLGRFWRLFKPGYLNQDFYKIFKINKISFPSNQNLVNLENLMKIMVQTNSILYSTGKLNSFIKFSGFIL